MLTVQRSGSLDVPVSVDYATSDHTAIAGQDYVATKGRLKFAAEEMRKIIRIPILNDALKESTKSFRFSLSNPTGPTGLGQLKAATINIVDNNGDDPHSAQYMRARRKRFPQYMVGYSSLF